MNKKKPTQKDSISMKNILVWFKNQPLLKILSLSTIALVLGLIMDSFGLIDKIISCTEPKVELAYFTYDSSGYPVINKDGFVDFKLSTNFLESGYTEIPINFAVRNLGNQKLDLVRLEIRYDRDLKVISNGQQKIDPDENLIIYEHNFGTIEAIDDYTIIKNVDILKIPFSFSSFPVLAITKEGVPIYYYMLVGVKGDFPINESIKLDITLFSSNRKPVKGIVEFIIAPTIDFYLPTIESGFSFEKIDQNDMDKFLANINDSFKIINHWEKQANDDHLIYEYFFVEDNENYYQFALVESQVRLLNVDLDKNMLVDYMIVDINKDGKPDKKYIPNPPYKMIDWDKESVP